LNTYDHAFGGTCGGCRTSFHHNLFACNTGRNPSIGMSYDFNFVNNVLFNWHHRTLDGGDQGSRVNCINNYFKPGPDTLAAVSHRIGKPQASTFRPDPTRRYGKWYVAGNIVDGDPSVTEDNWNGGIQFDLPGANRESAAVATNHVQELMAAVRANQPFDMAPLRIESAAAAYVDVLDHAGATLPDRDAVDQRAVRQARTGRVDYQQGHGIITDVSQVGGYPKYKGEPVKDLCADGIPLSWKVKYGLDTNDVDLARKDLRGDGYTVMDKYLDGLDPTQKIDWNDPASSVNTLAASR
jgi:hypothetical protein